MTGSRVRRPLIVITVADPERSNEPAIAALKNELYAAAVRRAGGEPRLVGPSASREARRSAFERMDGLLLSGGADIEPRRYGRDVDGARDVEPDRDALEAEAWAAAERRDRPVLGICRGLQAVNVFAGGTLTQHVDDHAGPAFGHGDPVQHELRLVEGARLATLLEAAGLGDGERVNSYHHQAVAAADLAPGLVAAGWSTSPAGPIVEALEASGDRWVMAVQCHPERRESTPPALERLFEHLVIAAGAPREPGGQREPGAPRERAAPGR